MNKREALLHVADLISGSRSHTHGEAVQQLAHAQFLKRHAGHRLNPKLSEAECEAIDMILVKISRLANGEPIEDHYFDIAGYAAIAVEALGKNKASIRFSVGDIVEVTKGSNIGLYGRIIIINHQQGEATITYGLTPDAYSTDISVPPFIEIFNNIKHKLT